MKVFQYIFVGLLFLANFSCQSQQAQISGKSDVSKISETADSNKKTDEIVETFSDDSNVGVAGKNKVEIFNYKKTNRNLAVIKFYVLDANKKWSLKQNLEFEKDDLIGISPEIKDFNNDGLKDVTYVSDVAARSANQIRKLFIYDKKNDQLIYIKNSDQYPNLLYNKELNCLDTFMIHGTSTTLFLKIESDSLKEFAGVGNNGTERTVYSIDKNGKQKILRKDKITEDDVYTRYKNFDPLKEYTAEDLKQ